MTGKLLLFALFICSMLLMSVNYKKKKKKIVFFGDSITEFGTGTRGYIRQLQYFLQQQGIEENYELRNEGVAGDKVYDLYFRLEKDVLLKGADYVVIFIGINDIGHKFSKSTGTDISRFEAFYIAIIEKLLLSAIKVLLCTPAVIGEKASFATRQDEEISLYSNVIRSLGLQYNLPVIDVRKAFIEYLAINNFEDLEHGILTIDKVHLNDRGNQLVAEEMWKILRENKVIMEV